MNNLFVISGPSGSGKSTLIQRLLKDFPDLRFSVSHTTRPPRPGETSGKEYFFVSTAEFQRMIDAGRFAEWAEVHDHRYGTSRKEIEEKSSGRQILVLDIDVQGAKSIKRSFPKAEMVFVVPPSLSVLKARLRRREGELSEEFERRLETARQELREYPAYDYLLVNGERATAHSQLKSLLVAFRLAMARNGDAVERLFGEQK